MTFGNKNNQHKYLYNSNFVNTKLTYYWYVINSQKKESYVIFVKKRLADFCEKICNNPKKKYF